jgi:hypothetical protein
MRGVFRCVGRLSCVHVFCSLAVLQHTHGRQRLIGGFSLCCEPCTLPVCASGSALPACCNFACACCCHTLLARLCFVSPGVRVRSCKAVCLAGCGSLVHLFFSQLPVCRPSLWCWGTRFVFLCCSAAPAFLLCCCRDVFSGPLQVSLLRMTSAAAVLTTIAGPVPLCALC